METLSRVFVAVSEYQWYDANGQYCTVQLAVANDGTAWKAINDGEWTEFRQLPQSNAETSNPEAAR